MKKLSFFLGLIVSSFLLLSALPVFAQVQYPEPRGYVNDFANILPDDFEQNLETTLRDYEQKTTNEIAVVTVPSLEGLSIEEYTIGLAEKWGVGKKGKDNGVVLLIAFRERMVRIEVGYGLEPVLTDAKAKLIIEKMTPYFKKGDYAGGIEIGVQKITDTIGYLTPEEIEQQKKEKEARDKAALATFGKAMMWIAILVFLVIISIIIRKKISARNRERARLRSLRENLRAKIPETLKGKDILLESLRTIKVELLKKYLPHHHEMIKSEVEKSEVLSELCQTLLEEATELLEKKPDEASARFKKARSLVVEMKSKRDKLIEFDQMSARINTGLTTLMINLEPISLTQALEEIMVLKREAPSEAWSGIEQKLGQFETLKGSIQNLIQEARHFNSSEVQKFEEAQTKLEEAQRLFRELREIVDAPGKKMREFKEAKEKITSLKQELEQKIEKAEKKTRDSDAERKSKTLLSEAKSKQRESESKERDDPINWIAVASLLAAAIALADKSYREAENSINSAYHYRHYNSSWSSSHGSYGGHSGGFGGFGGGGFGGGGASGHF